METEVNVHCGGKQVTLGDGSKDSPLLKRNTVIFTANVTDFFNVTENS